MHGPMKFVNSVLSPEGQAVQEELAAKRARQARAWGLPNWSKVVIVHVAVCHCSNPSSGSQLAFVAAAESGAARTGTESRRVIVQLALL